MAITWRISPEIFMDEVEISRVQKTLVLLKLEEVTAIDSYRMSPNGPILQSIILLGEGFISEVLMGGKHLVFDFSSIKLLANYRVTYGEHSAQSDSPVAPETVIDSDTTVAQPTRFVSINLSHTDTLKTNMSFFGEDVDSWVEFVLKAYSPAHVLG
jgi:hypothetical protein